jgi:hypothetical protein
MATLQILLVGHGNGPIPPNGWGAVESLVWEYYTHLTRKGHAVSILNTQHTDTVVSLINHQHWDIIHFHNDIFIHLLPEITSSARMIFTSHFPYIHDSTKWQGKGGYDYATYVMNPFVFSANEIPNVFVGVVSPKDYDVFAKSVKPEKLFLMLNGASEERFRFSESPTRAHQTVCMAQLMKRKRQRLLHGIPNVVLVGKILDAEEANESQYAGEWTDEQKHRDLTEYGNAVLVSDGENGTPLSIKEALIAGLGVVVSEAAASELPDWPWVTKVSETDLQCPSTLGNLIEMNRLISATYRAEIRQKAIELWGWSMLVDRYVETVLRLGY